jgi:predicted nucleic acid-binding protein
VIIVDTLIIASFWLPSEFSEAAIQALKKDPQWTAPFLWRTQFRNIVAARLRRREITLELGLKFLAGAETMLKGSEFFVPYGQVMEQVRRSNCSAFACEFVALAQDLNCPLITLDAQTIADFPKLAQHLTQFVET